jgi:RNA polymerase sigma-70 factor (ECF subfamily)
VLHRGTPDLIAATDAMLASSIAAAVPGGAHEEEAELYRRFAPRVRLYGLKHLRDAAAAQDLVQEVFVVTLERLLRRSPPPAAGCACANDPFRHA